MKDHNDITHFANFTVEDDSKFRDYEERLLELQNLANDLMRYLKIDLVKESSLGLVRIKLLTQILPYVQPKFAAKEPKFDVSKLSDDQVTKMVSVLKEEGLLNEEN